MDYVNGSDAPGGKNLYPGLLATVCQGFSNYLLLQEAKLTMGENRLLLDGSHQASFQIGVLAFDELGQSQVISPVSQGEKHGCQG